MTHRFTLTGKSLLLQVVLPIFLAFFSLSLQAQTEIQTAKSYLNANASKHKIAQEDIDRMAISSSYLSPTTGWYHVYFNQTYQSIEVFNSMMSLVIKDNQVQYATGSFVPNIAGLVNAGPAALSPVQALQKAAQEANMPINGPATIKEISSAPLADGSPGKVIFTAESLSDENIVVKKYWLVYEAKEGMKTRTKAALTWNVQFLTKDQQNSWSMHVDAQTGEIVRKVDEVIHCNFGMLHRTGIPHDCTVDHAPVGTNTVLAPTTALAPDKTYRVFDYPLEAPTFGSRTLVSSPYTKFVPTGTGPAGTNNTNGWHFDGTTDYTNTRGNNVWAQEDKTLNNTTSVTQTTSATLDFDFPYTLGTGNAVRNANTDAAVTNLFYWSNLIHDVLWKYGFDEPSGNFQNNNQGRGGLGADYLLADAQDGSGINNANFSTPPDGTRPRMQMFMWNFTGAGYNADGDFDNGIVSHEYGHGWSTRLTGGPANSACLQNAEQGGEGWSDFLSLMLTTDWSTLTPTVASANIPRGIGTYAFGQPTTGPGIRPYRYSYDMANINPLVTYGKVGVFDGSVFAQPHGIGSIWATMLWDMTWEIILQDNQIVNNIYDIPALTTDMRGNLAALKLVNEGLRMQPCSPSFVDARDAILAADQLLFGGRYHCAIGRAFARRGLGLNASTGTTSNDHIVIEDFTPSPTFKLGSPTTVPAICTNTPFSYTATAASGAPTFSWTRSTIAGISNAATSGSSATISETLINTTSNPITVNYYFTLSPDACNAAAAQKVSVVVNPSAVPTVAAYSVCQNASVPGGQGLVVPAALTNVVTGSLTAMSPTYHRGVGSAINTYIAATPGVNTDNGAGDAVHYQTFTFVAPTTERVIFETVDANLINSDPYDTYITLYQTSFNPASPATNFLFGDDDSGTLLFSSKPFYDLVAGATYVLVVSTYWNAALGPFTIQSSIPVFPGGTNNWYKDPSGGSPLATGEIFNPVGVAGSGITNTATAGTTPFYVANAVFPDCRTPVSFIVNPIHTITLTSAAPTESQSVCLNSPITPITYALGGGATGVNIMGLPTGVTSSITAGVLTISGSSTSGGLFNYSITTTGSSCTPATKSGSITVNPNHILTLTSAPATEAQTGCTGSSITPITYFLGGGATGANVTGLPMGVTSSVAAGVLTISGTPTVSGTFNYSITTTGNACNIATKSGTLNLNTKPVITLAVIGQTLNEGTTSTLCDTDANPSNSLQFNLTTACISGSLVWRTQIGAGAWSSWSATTPGTQPSDNTTYKYQATCDVSCTSSYTHPITLTINYRASTPQNVSLMADGTNVAAGESKTICDLTGNTLTFNATCAAGEMVLYSVDGGDYSTSLPSQIVDGNFHNYRVRCRKADNTPSCAETESGVMTLKITTTPLTPVVSITPTSGCGAPVAFTGSSTCGTFATIWYNATTNMALPNLPTTTPTATTSYYARCRNEAGCEGGVSNTVTYTLTPVNEAPTVTASADMVCTGTQVTISANCPAGSTAFWNTGVSANSFQVAFANVTTQTYWAKCIFANGCQSPESAHKSVFWKAFELTFINIGQSQSGIKAANDRNLWASQFITKDAGPVLENSTQTTPTIYYTERPNKGGPRFWTIQVETCNLGTDGSITYDLLAAPEVGVAQSFNTHENNAPYLMYANREGWTELYAQNHPAYGFYQSNGSGGNTYDTGLPKGLYKLGIRYWDQKGQGSIYPSTRQPAGNVLAYQEYWFRIQSQNGIGAGATRIATDLDPSGMTNMFAQVMPNPVFNILRLKVNDAKGENVNVNLLDATGRVLLQRDFIPQTNQHLEEFEVSPLSNGIYFMMINTAEKQTTLKIIKADF